MKTYDTLQTLISQYIKFKDIRHLKTFCWIIIGIIQSGSINLTYWIDYIESKAEKADSIVRRFSRFLSNKNIEIEKLYTPLIKELLKEWANKILYIMLDTTVLWDRYCVTRIILNYRGRGISLAWDIKEQRGSVINIEFYKPLLKKVKELLPLESKVILLADRGFADTDLMDFVSKELNWNWRIRVKGHYYIYKGDKKIKIGNIRPLKGKAEFYNKVYLTAKKYGYVNLACGCPINGEEYWYVVSNEPVSIETFDEYALRFDIEETFRDEKSGGFDIAHSRIRDIEKLKRLYFVLSVATICLVSQGMEIVETGKRRYIDPHYYRGLSYFQLGWRWIRRAIIKNYQDIISKLFLSSEIDKEPVISSKKKYEKKKELKFLLYKYVVV